MESPVEGLFFFFTPSSPDSIARWPGSAGNILNYLPAGGQRIPNEISKAFNRLPDGEQSITRQEEGITTWEAVPQGEEIAISYCSGFRTPRDP